MTAQKSQGKFCGNQPPGDYVSLGKFEFLYICNLDAENLFHYMQNCLRSDLFLRCIQYTIGTVNF